MQRDALVLSGAGAAAAGQRRGARAPPPPPAPGRARALHDVPGAPLWPALGHAGCGVRLGRLRGGRSRGGQDHQQELQHRRPQTQGEKARGGAGPVTPAARWARCNAAAGQGVGLRRGVRRPLRSEAAPPAPAWTAPELCGRAGPSSWPGQGEVTQAGGKRGTGPEFTAEEVTLDNGDQAGSAARTQLTVCLFEWRASTRPRPTHNYCYYCLSYGGDTGERERLGDWREEIYLFKELDEIDTQLGSSQVFKLTFFCEVHFNTRNLIREAGLLFTLHQILEFNSHSLETEMRREEEEFETKKRGERDTHAR